MSNSSMKKHIGLKVLFEILDTKPCRAIRKSKKEIIPTSERWHIWQHVLIWSRPDLPVLPDVSSSLFSLANVCFIFPSQIYLGGTLTSFLSLLCMFGVPVQFVYKKMYIFNCFKVFWGLLGAKPCRIIGKSSPLKKNLGPKHIKLRKSANPRARNPIKSIWKRPVPKQTWVFLGRSKYHQVIIFNLTETTSIPNPYRCVWLIIVVCWKHFFRCWAKFWILFFKKY